MFNIDNKKIGAFISRLIEEKFTSARQFCIAYLKTDSNEEPTEDEIRNMANRLSQIKKGTKAIQIYDLPIFSELLDISFEQILSAGKSGTPKNSRMTNYTIAQSHNKKEWVIYIEREDTPILNTDEYGKTVIDYAVEYNNYEFLKFLVNKKYIWLDTRIDNGHITHFYATTSIKYTKPQTHDLQCTFATEDQLRMYIISCAADHNDLKILEELRAREIPELYLNASFYHPNLDFNVHYDKNMVSHIAKSSCKVLDYFTDPFEIRDQIRYKDGSRPGHTFIFPYISQLLNMLIENNSPFLKTALEKAIAHNEWAMEKLLSLINQFINSDFSFGDNWKSDIEFYEHGNLISFYNYYMSNRIITNIAHVTKKSKDAQIGSLIQKLNNSYNSIRNIKTEGLK